MKKGLRHIVGDGRNTFIEGDVWVGKDSISLNQNQGSDILNQKVSSLISTPGVWNSNLICNSFAKKDARNILSTHLPAKSCVDEIVWGNTIQGRTLSKQELGDVRQHRERSIER